MTLTKSNPQGGNLMYWNLSGESKASCIILSYPTYKQFQDPIFGENITGMEETEEQLNRDFNYNLVLAKSGIPNFLPLQEDRRLATAWLRKLSTSDTSIEELRVRNVFAYYLVLAIQDGQLGSPFTNEPPDAPLVSLHHLLPGDAYESDNESPREATEEGESLGQRPGPGPSNAMDQSLLYEHSPDGGAFLAAQPVPRCGAFCYLAVVARQDQ